MRAKYRSLFSALVFLGTCAVLFAAPASATVVIFYASNYAVGTNLTNAFPGATLEYASLPLNHSTPFNLSPLIVESLDKSYPATFNTLGSSTSQMADWLNGAPSGDAYAIYIVFTQPVYSVSAADFSPSGDPTLIVDLNTQGGINTWSSTNIDFCSVLICTGPDGGIGQGETFSSSTPITSVLIGAANSANYITEINYSLAAPEPPSIALFGCGLLALGIVILRRRRQSNLV